MHIELSKKLLEPASGRRVGEVRPAPRQRAQLRWLVVNLFFNLVAIKVDTIALGDGFAASLALRLFLVTPLLLIAIALHFSSSNMELRSFFTGTATVAFIATVAGVAQFANDAFSSRYLMIATFMVFVAVLFSGLRWHATIVTACTAWILYSLFAVININLQVAYMNVDLIFLCGSTAALALVLRRRLDVQLAQIRAMGEVDARRVAELNEANARLARLSHTDSLTGLPNRRQLDEFVESFEASLAPDIGYGVLMIDIDHFKLLNDRSGHAEGDRCLKLVAQTLARGVRTGDSILARYGGEEFALVLRGADTRLTQMTAEWLRLAVAELGMPNPGLQTGIVTVSVGGYAACHNEAITDALRYADQMLYVAKASGRNRVEIGSHEKVDRAFNVSHPQSNL